MISILQDHQKEIIQQAVNRVASAEYEFNRQKAELVNLLAMIKPGGNWKFDFENMCWEVDDAPVQPDQQDEAEDYGQEVAAIVQ